MARKYNDLGYAAGFVGAALAVLAGLPAAAQQTATGDDWRATYTLYGTPGVIDMPSAVAPEDAEIATTVAVFGDTQRATFSFQVLPRVTGSFRYSLIDTYDRSFDLQYQIATEGRVRPALAVGLRDFIGTGRYSGEYVVATKTITPNLRLSGGLGWGRLGSLDGFTNPLGALNDKFETRPNDSIQTGGTILTGQFFRGDAAFFGGVEWRLNEDWTVLAEYSSDAYTREERLVGFDRQSPLNFGVTWAPRPGYQLGAYYMYGTDLGLSATFITDPKTRNGVTGFDSAPFPVQPRGSDAVAAASWDSPQASQAGTQVLGTVLASDGFRLIGAETTGTTLRVRYQNTSYRSEAQGIGRVARLMTVAAPAEIDTFVLEPVQRGIPLSAVTIQRSDMEQLENAPNATALSYDRAQFGDAGAAPAYSFTDDRAAFVWGISPYVEVALFDGDKPARADVGLEAAFRYELRPNIVAAGAYRYRLLGNRDEVGSIAASTLPDVRRTGQRYGAESGGGIENLYLAWYGRPGRDLYSRVSAGYLERGFAGVSSEVLWKPTDSNLALGAELNYTMLRDFDQGFGFRPVCSDSDCTVYTGDNYDVVTGHVSAYYDFDNGFLAQVDVGRYLAGDWGATFGLDRTFSNGWKVGGYFTLTDVEFEDFGEGSFDKGIRIEIPLDALAGVPTRDTTGTTLTSLERDGGARLRVDGRLYDIVEGGHQTGMADNWGRFWR